MRTYYIGYDLLNRKVYVAEQVGQLPSNAANLGSFNLTTDDEPDSLGYENESRVLYHGIRDKLYAINEQDMQTIEIDMIEPVLQPLYFDKNTININEDVEIHIQNTVYDSILRASGLPAGLELDSHHRRIIGRATAGGDAFITLEEFRIDLDASRRTFNLKLTVAASAGTDLTITGTPSAGTIDVPYLFIPTVFNAVGTKTFAIQNKPAGMTFNTSTGALSGTPSDVGTNANIRISVTASNGTANLPPFSLIVGDPIGPTTAEFTSFVGAGTPISDFVGLLTNERVLSVTPPNGRIALASGGYGNLTGSVASPVGSVTYTYTTSLGRVFNQVAVTTNDVTAPNISTVGEITIPESTPWSLMLASDDSTAKWSIVAGDDATFFSITPEGLISMGAVDYEAPGDDGTNNTYIVTVKAVDDVGNASTKTLTVTIANLAEASAPVNTVAPSLSNNTGAIGEVLTVNVGTWSANAPLALAGTPVTTAKIGDPYAGFTLVASGGVLPYAYAAVNPLPAGITLNPTTGVVSGTPSGTAGTTNNIILKVTDAANTVVNLTAFSIVVSPAVAVVGEVLPGLASAPLAVYGLTKLVNAYNGPAIRVIRVSDSAEADIGFASLSLDTSATFLQVASEYLVKTWYDQSGGTKHLTTTAGNEPSLWLGVGGPSIVNYPTTKPFLIPTTLAPERQNLSVLMVCRTPGLGAANAWFGWGDATTKDYGLRTSTAGTQYQPMPEYDAVTSFATNGTNNARANAIANKSILALVSNAQKQQLHRDDQIVDYIATTAKTLNMGGHVGDTAAIAGRNDMMAWIVYPALSDADMVTLKASLKNTYKTVGVATKSIHARGDSIVFGTGAIHNYTLTAAMAAIMADTVILRNTGVAGTRLGQTYLDFATANTAARFTYTGVPNVFYGNYGHNDIKGYMDEGMTGANVLAQMKSQIKTLCADLREKAGFDFIIWSEAFADKSAGWTTDMETVRLAWNTWLNTNPVDNNNVKCFNAIDKVATDSAFVLSDSETAAGRGMALTANSGDGIHPAEAMATARATHLVATINAAAATPLAAITTAAPSSSVIKDATFANFTVSGKYGTAPYNYSLVGSWPANSVVSNTGVVSGAVFTAVGTISGLKVRVTDSLGVTADYTVPDIAVVAVPTGNTLDAITAAPSAAFSLRKLRAAYAGSCIKVRRSTDNTATDIGFDSNGDLDTTALMSFAGVSGTTTVETWYDQSTNARHATNTVVSTQPIIVNGGVLQVRNNKPCLNFGASKVLATPLPADSNIRSFRMVGDHRSNSNSDILRSSANGGWNVRFSAAHALQLLTTGSSILMTSTALETLNTLAYFAIDYNNPALSLSIDGGTQTSGNAAAAFTAGLTTLIGGGTSQATGISSLLVFDGAILSSADSGTIFASNKAYWGTN